MKHYRRLQIQLSAAEKREIEGLLSRGVQQVRVVLRALALRQLSTGQTPPQVAQNLDLSPKAVRAIGARFEKEGRVNRNRLLIQWNFKRQDAQRVFHYWSNLSSRSENYCSF
jgi:hypothetical protein